MKEGKFMRKMVKKALQSCMAGLLIFCCVVMPVNAENEYSNLEATDYQVGMDSLANVSEEEWVNSAENTAYSVLNIEDGFIEVGNSNETTELLATSYSIQTNGELSTKSYNGIICTESQEGNAVKEKSAESGIEAQISVSSNDIQIMTAPTAGIQPYILNEDSLRDGMVTTETEIAWLFTGDATVYYYGGFQSDYIIERASDGFITKFYTPGTYSVLCYGENEAGEASEVTGFTITVVSEFAGQTIEDSLSSATDTKSYSVDIDFTNMDTAAVCIVRTGKTEVQMQIADENGNVIQPYATIYSIPKRWVYIDKPSQEAQVCHYTITVTASSFNEVSGAFRVIIGNKDDAEAMMGGLENAIDLDLFRDSQNNFIASPYSPRSDEYWFITSMPFPTVITLLSNDSSLRFKLKDMDTLQDLFDSNDSQWADMHSTRFTGSFSRAEKATFEALTGPRRYLVIYSNTPSEGSGVLEKEFRLGAGQPMYGLTNQTVYGSSITVGASAYSSTTLNTDTSSFANTGVMNQAYLSGVSLSKLDRWRLLAPNSVSYKTSSIGSTYITYNFTPGGSLNTHVKGLWDLGIKLKSGNSSISCYPSVNFSFYYEYGDDTITIVPAE